MRAFLIPQRFFVCIMIGTATMVSYMARSNMSVNILAMVKPNSGRNDTNITSIKDTEVDIARYDWDSEVQGLILGAYFWGYSLASVPGGLIAEKFGPTHTVGISTILTGICTLLFPVAAKLHYGVVVFLRLIIGLLGGLLYPGLHCLIAKWAPPIEKGKFIAATMANALGTVLTWIILGQINYNWGWNWAFYIPGIIILLWCVIWYYLITDFPSNHPRIGESEKAYIAEAQGGVVSKKKAIAPYKSILTSIPMWALVVLHFGNAWGLFFLLTVGPKYLKEILGFDIKSSGALASLPHLARFVMGFFFGFIGDVIRKKGWMTVSFARKFFVIFSAILPGLFLLGQLGAGDNPGLAVALLTLSLGMNGAASLTNLQNPQDLAPNFAASVYGIANFIGSTAGFINPAVVGAITKYNNTMAEWKSIFIISASIYIITGVVFICFGTGETQHWNAIPDEEEEKEEEGIKNPAFEDKLGSDFKDISLSKAAVA